ASALFVGLCYNGPLAFWQGALLFGLLVLFLADSTRIALNNGNGPSEFEEEANELIGESQAVSKSLALTFLLIVVGVVGLPIGAHLTVSGASQIAASLGISNAAIGLTAVALGTSLPELVTTLSCTLRGHGAMAIGNILGSNLFNILAVMGVTAMLAPVPVHEAILRIDLWVMLAAALVITPFALGKLRLTRFPAALFVLAYIAYTVFVLAPKNGL
ncbi:MAG TPA: sodium:calcium antiporter, partial [Rhizobiales bacterium]|nr:sodium:calcium antiporter [Hyphomicrobiales bacterium]